MLLEEMREIHSAERQLQRALPKLNRNIETEDLQSAMQARIEQSQRLIEDLDNAFEELGASKGRRKNAAVEGLLEETNELVDQIEDPMLREAALIGAVQKLEHYCIAAWGTSRSMAQALGRDSVVECMERALEEGKQQDQELTQIAEKQVYPALQDGEDRQEGGGRARGEQRQAGGQRDPSGARKSGGRKEEGATAQGQRQGGGGQQSGNR